MRTTLINHGTINKNSVEIETKKARIVIYFSYNTPISFKWWNKRDKDEPNGENYVNETRINDWSVTTGKFLNECCPDHSQRIDGENFEKLLEKYQNKI